MSTSAELRTLADDNAPIEEELRALAAKVEAMEGKLDVLAPWVCLGECGVHIKVTEFGECAHCGEEAKHREDL